MKDKVFGINIEAKSFKPFTCARCGEVVGYYWDAEYENLQSVCLHVKCFEDMKVDEGNNA